MEITASSTTDVLVPDTEEVGTTTDSTEEEIEGEEVGTTTDSTEEIEVVEAAE